jgi:hypothetical protein
VKVVDEDGTVTYNKIPGKKTKVVVQQDPLHRKQGNPEGIWYVFMMTPKKVITEFEGSKQRCIEYAERIVRGLEEENKKKGLKQK